MKEVKAELGIIRVRLSMEMREWILQGMLLADNLVLSCKVEENLRVFVRRFDEICKKSSHCDFR